MSLMRSTAAQLLLQNISLLQYLLQPMFYCRTWAWRGTGRRRPVGCLKLQVIFRKRATNYRALLRKMKYKDGSLPPCIYCGSCSSAQHGSAAVNPNIWNDLYVTCLTHTSHVWYNVLIRDVTHSHLRCMTRLVHCMIFLQLLLIHCDKFLQFFEWDDTIKSFSILWLSHVTRMVESHVAHVNALCHTYDWVLIRVMTHKLVTNMCHRHLSRTLVTRRVTRMIESWYESWHTNLSRTCATDTCHKHLSRVVSHVWLSLDTSHDTQTCHDSFICVTLLDLFIRDDVFIRLTWLIHMCVTTQSYVWRDSWQDWIICDVSHTLDTDTCHEHLSRTLVTTQSFVWRDAW